MNPIHLHPCSCIFVANCVLLSFRNFQRLIPVTEICRANIESIHKTVSEKFLPEFSGHDKAPIKVGILKYRPSARTFCNAF